MHKLATRVEQDLRVGGNKSMFREFRVLSAQMRRNLFEQRPQFVIKEKKYFQVDTELEYEELQDEVPKEGRHGIFTKKINFWAG